MENRLMLVVLAVLAIVVLAWTLVPKPQPTQAQAQNWTVLAGANEDDEALQALRFLPEKLTIHVGDSVTWKLGGEEHTIYFPAGGPRPMLELVGPDGREYFNPAVFFPSEGKTYDGSKPFSGGYLSPDNDTFTLTFTKPGVYEYHCVFHPGMKGTITVIAANQPLPKTRADYTRTARSEAQQTLMKARELYDQLHQPKVNAKPDGSKEYVLDLVGDPKTMATILRFEPSPLRIKVGDTVTWRMLDYTEAHTVTFLEDPEETPELVMVEPQENGPPLLVINPVAWKPMGGAAHTGSGYYNSGAMFRPEGEEPSTYSLTFTQPGTYEYICLIHAMMGMEGTIIVESQSMPTVQTPAPAIGFTLHIDAKKHINELPEFVVHHYCKNIDSQVIQCMLFDSDAPNAHVIGVETIISPEIYAKLPQEEQASWHYHKDEIPLVDAKLPGLSDEEIEKVVAAVENTYGRVVIFWVPGASAPMGIPSVVNPQSGHPTETTVTIPPEIPAITIKAKDYAFELPDEMNAGPVAITLENDGAEPHHVQLARLKDRVTMENVQDALRQGPESALFDLLEWVGGASVVMPGGRQQVLLDLSEGQYVLLCFVASPDGVPHFAKGMVKFVNVVARGSQRVTLQNVKSSISVKLRDFFFQLPETIQEGSQIWTVANEGVQPHEMTLIKLAPGKTIQDAMNFIQSESPQGPPPFEFAGGMQALATGKTGWVVLNLPAGTYVALCFVPDPQSGKPHVELGMIQAFTVSSK